MTGLCCSSQVLLDPEVPGFAEDTIFVAGDRVTTDLLAQPFSMGRNLLCIFSKKHIENPPEQKVRSNYALLYRQLHAIHDRASDAAMRQLKLPRAYLLC